MTKAAGGKVNENNTMLKNKVISIIYSCFENSYRFVENAKSGDGLPTQYAEFAMFSKIKRNLKTFSWFCFSSTREGAISI